MRYGLPLAALALSFLFFAAAPSQRPVPAAQPQQAQAAGPQQPAPTDQRGTEQSPLVLKILPTQNAQEETAAVARDRQQKAANDEVIEFDSRLVRLGYLQLAVFLGQLFVFGYQAWKLRETVKAAGDQSVEMKSSVKEAAKAATAIASVAESMATNVGFLKETVATNKEIAARQKLTSEMQLRAYLNAVIGGGVYQERDKKLRFEGRVVLINQGATQATKVTYRSRSAILPAPLPKDFELPPLPVEPGGETMIGPQQNRVLNAMIADYVDDAEVDDIKRGIGKGLYIWGAVTYEDAFKESRETIFCHMLTWLPNNEVWGYYISNRNSVT